MNEIKTGDLRVLPTNFIYPELNEENHKYGASFLTNPIINPSGDWRKSLPPYEEQRRFNVETSSCYVEGQEHTIATIEEMVLGELDNNYSARFNALLSGGTSSGGDPVAGADSIRHDGLVREESMPHREDILSWDEFHSWKGVDETKVRAEGKEDLKKKERNFGVFITRELPLATKYTLLEQGLKRSPIPMSVWGVVDDTGNYIQKPDGTYDTHLVEATYLDRENKVIHILDTYPPFEKTLPANYNPDFGMGWTVSFKKGVKKNWLIDLCARLWLFIKDLLTIK
ncbi:MAG: hypothetical protein U1E54_03315 [Candidatus Levybacteria bacterium]|nr:hypothetical protein [Candidatus Levybacteria bacterium]